MILCIQISTIWCFTECFVLCFILFVYVCMLFHYVPPRFVTQCLCLSNPFIGTIPVYPLLNLRPYLNSQNYLIFTHGRIYSQWVYMYIFLFYQLFDIAYTISNSPCFQTPQSSIFMELQLLPHRIIDILLCRSMLEEYLTCMFYYVFLASPFTV